MSDFSAARLRLGESHPSRFRASRKKAASLPSLTRSDGPYEVEEHFSPRPFEQISALLETLSLRSISRIEASREKPSDDAASLAQSLPPSNSDLQPDPAIPTVQTPDKEHNPLPKSLQLYKIKRKPVPPSMPPPSGPIRLFVASLGNPPPYQTTRHSAGHILLKRLQSHLSLPPLSRSKAGGYISHGSEVGSPQWTLWQSPTQMNISGIPLLKAYKTFLGSVEQEQATPALVILHDEMETQPAQLKLRRGPTSPKGHNGIKSVQQTFQSAGLMDKLTSTDGGGSNRFLKVAVGIGRPPGGTREKDDVSAYVLGQLSAQEKHGIEGSVGQLVQMLEMEMGRMMGSGGM